MVLIYFNTSHTAFKHPSYWPPVTRLQTLRGPLTSILQGAYGAATGEVQRSFGIVAG